MLRDFSLRMVDKNDKEMNSDEYLEFALTEQEGYSDEVMNKNAIRQLLKEYFHMRKCFAFVQPLSDEAKLQNLNQLSFASLRKEFREQVINFRKHLFGNVKTKRIGGKEVSG